MSSNRLFRQTNTPKPKDIQFITTFDQKKKNLKNLEFGILNLANFGLKKNTKNKIVYYQLNITYLTPVILSSTHIEVLFIVGKYVVGVQFS